MNSFTSTPRRHAATGVLIAACIVNLFPLPLYASDHADPIDPFNSERLEGGITDLFVFPVLKSDAPANPFSGNTQISLSSALADAKRTPLIAEQRAETEALVFILCVRRALTEKDSLALEPYKYVIHVDTDSRVSFPWLNDSGEETYTGTPAATGAGYQSSPAPASRITREEAFLRYGGLVQNPENISEELTIEFQLNNKAQLLDGFPKYSGMLTKNWTDKEAQIRDISGLYDDPFIFPAFFGTNVVAMAVRVPMEYFGEDSNIPHDFLIWATSHKRDRQVDHVGRSLRTQNPRFELLNTIHPSQHVAAIVEEHTHPSLMRDLFLRINLQQLYGYRQWDFVPDVMIWTDRFPVGFPNGRLLTDDVAALLAQFGDTLLYELSYHNARWPRDRFNDHNDQEFSDSFPYLANPQDYIASLGPDRKPKPRPMLSNTSKMKLAGIGGGLVILLLVENWFVIKFFSSGRKRRELSK